MLAAIGKLIVSAILDWVAGLVAKYWRQKKQDDASEEQAKESVKPLKEAKTGEEIDKATDGALDGW